MLAAMAGELTSSRRGGAHGRSRRAGSGSSPRRSGWWCLPVRVRSGALAPPLYSVSPTVAYARSSRTNSYGHAGPLLAPPATRDAKSPVWGREHYPGSGHGRLTPQVASYDGRVEIVLPEAVITEIVSRVRDIVMADLARTLEAAAWRGGGSARCWSWWAAARWLPRRTGRSRRRRGDHRSQRDRPGGPFGGRADEPQDHVGESPMSRPPSSATESSYSWAGSPRWWAPLPLRFSRSLRWCGTESEPLASISGICRSRASCSAAINSLFFSG
jgi:hypothetical protein